MDFSNFNYLNLSLTLSTLLSIFLILTTMGVTLHIAELKEHFFFDMMYNKRIFDSFRVSAIIAFLILLLILVLCQFSFEKYSKNKGKIDYLIIQVLVCLSMVSSTKYQLYISNTFWVITIITRQNKLFTRVYTIVFIYMLTPSFFMYKPLYEEHERYYNFIYIEIEVLKTHLMFLLFPTIFMYKEKCNYFGDFSMTAFLISLWFYAIDSKQESLNILFLLIITYKHHFKLINKYDSKAFCFLIRFIIKKKIPILRRLKFNFCSVYDNHLNDKDNTFLVVPSLNVKGKLMFDYKSESPEYLIHKKDVIFRSVKMDNNEFLVTFFDIHKKIHYEKIMCLESAKKICFCLRKSKNIVSFSKEIFGLSFYHCYKFDEYLFLKLENFEFVKGDEKNIIGGLEIKTFVDFEDEDKELRACLYYHSVLFFRKFKKDIVDLILFAKTNSNKDLIKNELGNKRYKYYVTEIREIVKQFNKKIWLFEKTFSNQNLHKKAISDFLDNETSVHYDSCLEDEIIINGIIYKNDKFLRIGIEENTIPEKSELIEEAKTNKGKEDCIAEKREEKTLVQEKLTKNHKELSDKKDNGLNSDGSNYFVLKIGEVEKEKKFPKDKKNDIIIIESNLSGKTNFKFCCDNNRKNPDKDNPIRIRRKFKPKEPVIEKRSRSEMINKRLNFKRSPNRYKPIGNGGSKNKRDVSSEDITFFKKPKIFEFEDILINLNKLNYKKEGMTDIYSKNLLRIKELNISDNKKKILENVWSIFCWNKVEYNKSSFLKDKLNKIKHLYNSGYKISKKRENEWNDEINNLIEPEVKKVYFKEKEYLEELSKGLKKVSEDSDFMPNLKTLLKNKKSLEDIKREERIKNEREENRKLGKKDEPKFKTLGELFKSNKFEILNTPNFKEFEEILNKSLACSFKSSSNKGKGNKKGKKKKKKIIESRGKDEKKKSGSKDKNKEKRCNNVKTKLSLEPLIKGIGKFKSSKFLSLNKKRTDLLSKLRLYKKLLSERYNELSNNCTPAVSNKFKRNFLEKIYKKEGIVIVTKKKNEIVKSNLKDFLKSANFALKFNASMIIQLEKNGFVKIVQIEETGEVSDKTNPIFEKLAEEEITNYIIGIQIKKRNENFLSNDSKEFSSFLVKEIGKLKFIIEDIKKLEELNEDSKSSFSEDL